MNVAVRYFTRAGNTKKLAEAVGAAAGVPALPVSEALREPADLLFLGGALYGFDIDAPLKDFIRGLTPETARKAAVFSTTAIVPSAYPQIKKLLDAQGIPAAAQNFHSFGKFGPLHGSRPDANDCEKAGAFAREVLAACGE